ncbi:TPA: MFS transporter [Escherichia coli]|nr:MFS transporter [Escherichia coli]
MSHSSAPERATGAVITDWRPEDPAFWQQRGQRIASRNLWISVPCLLLAFCVWMLFSAVAVNLPKVGFNFTTDQLFMLTALPSVSGALLRVPYSFMVPIFGGRRWTAFSTGILIIPCVWLGFAVQDTSTPYSVFIIISLLCGFAGANFASSMANISFFFPKQKQGGALGLNGGLGNMGVSVMQLVAPLVVSLSIFAVFGSQGVKQPDGTELYLATFGSFIGFSAGFAMLSKTQFPDVQILQYAFFGPFIGALARSAGGALSDRLGGTRVTLVNFILMAIFSGLLFLTLPTDGQGGSFMAFFAVFLALFLTAGLGSGSTFQMISVIFRKLTMDRVKAEGGSDERAMREAATDTAAALGFISAIGAIGGFFIPKAFGSSLALTGSPVGAMKVFLIFYIACVVITWAVYGRHSKK